MRYSFSDDPTLSAAVFALLETAFPGLTKGAEHVRQLGASWESVSTPFLYFEDGRPVSHIGVIGLPLVILGRPVTVGSVHAVATHPDYRRRGHYRRLMGEVLRHTADRYETLILTTDHPEYYEPFGFRILQEHLFRVQCRSSGNPGGSRLLDLQDARDIALLNRLLETRASVSDVVGVINEKAVFFFNEGHRPLHYVKDLDVVVCMRTEGATLELFDVAGPKVPALPVLLERMPSPVEEVQVHFAADRLAPEAQPEPRVFDHDGPSYLMARGPFAAEAEPFTLPRSART